MVGAPSVFESNGVEAPSQGLCPCVCVRVVVRPVVHAAMQNEGTPTLQCNSLTAHPLCCCSTAGFTMAHPHGFHPLCMAGFGPPMLCVHGHHTLTNCTHDRAPASSVHATSNGAWVLDDCQPYLLDRGLADGLARFFGTHVIEFGAGKGCYTDALTLRDVPCLCGRTRARRGWSSSPEAWCGMQTSPSRSISARVAGCCCLRWPSTSLRRTKRCSSPTLIATTPRVS